MENKEAFREYKESPREIKGKKEQIFSETELHSCCNEVEDKASKNQWQEALETIKNMLKR
ncbi:MAG TPA: hypothetical protein VEC17_02255 [Candidatus Binatia bacterium]|nr:hypothetical protein [Candidatus Binatia bacterium]